jgi:hypothetical protein
LTGSFDAVVGSGSAVVVSGIAVAVGVAGTVGVRSGVEIGVLVGRDVSIKTGSTSAGVDAASSNWSLSMAAVQPIEEARMVNRSRTDDSNLLNLMGLC